MKYCNKSSFDALEYLSGLTGFVFDKAVLKRIAMDNDILDAETYADISEEQKDGCKIDLYKTILLSPNTSASHSNQHGAYSVSIGAQRTSKAVLEEVRNQLRMLLKKYDREEELEGVDDGLLWIDENEY